MIKMKKINITKRIRFVSWSTPLKEWKYMECFYFLPTIVTDDQNIVSESDKYMFSRSVLFLFLGFCIGIEWEHGKQSKYLV